MKAEKQNIHKLIILTLMVIHQVIAFMYIFLLPNLNNLEHRLSSTTHSEFVHKSSNSNSAGSILHRGIKSFIENKRKVLVPVVNAFTLMFSLIFGGILLAGLAIRSNIYQWRYGHSYSYSYLSLRTIRI